MAKTPKSLVQTAVTTAKSKTSGTTPDTTAGSNVVAVNAGIGSAPVEITPSLRKKELIDRVVSKSGAKRKDAKPVVEAMLDVLGDALAQGEELNLQPFGKLKINRQKEMAGAKVFVCRIRQRKTVHGTGADTE